MTGLQIATSSENEGKIAGSAREIVQNVESLVIKNDDDYAFALDLIKKIIANRKRADDERLSLTRPIKEAAKNIEARFKTLTDPLEKAEQLARQKAFAYHQRKEAIRREQEEAARIEAEKQAEEQRKAEEAAKVSAGGETAPESKEQPVDRSLPPKDDHILEVHNLKIPPLTNTKPSVRTESGTLGTIKKVWKYRVLDIKELANTNPAAVQPNHEGIMHCIQQGVRHMPGLEIYQEDQLQVR